MFFNGEYFIDSFRHDCTCKGGNKSIEDVGVTRGNFFGNENTITTGYCYICRKNIILFDDLTYLNIIRDYDWTEEFHE